MRLIERVAAITVRPYAERDFHVLVDAWHATNVVSYPYVAQHQQHTLADAQGYFRDHVLATCRVFVAELEARMCAMLALEGSWIRQLAVFPRSRRRGVGSALIAAAREISPAQLRLFTFQRNDVARAFYAQQDFVPIAFGVSPAPESEPDVELQWNAESS
ncbi:MAG: GNAT family N-acetyltransferase [Casimicrobiaceae bacterium]